MEFLWKQPVRNLEFDADAIAFWGCGRAIAKRDLVIAVCHCCDYEITQIPEIDYTFHSGFRLKRCKPNHKDFAQLGFNALR